MVESNHHHHGIHGSMTADNLDGGIRRFAASPNLAHWSIPKSTQQIR